MQTVTRPIWVQAAGLAGFALATAAAAWIGGMATATSVNTWYPTLRKPSWTPSGDVIGTVWTILYAAIAFSGWLVWRNLTWRSVGAPLTFWIIQLVLNPLWSILFFGLRMPGVAFTEIVALWAVILATTLAFFIVSTLAGILFVPYLAWVTFAAVLNWTIYRMNH